MKVVAGGSTPLEQGRGIWRVWAAMGGEAFSPLHIAQSSAIFGFNNLGVLAFFFSSDFSCQNPNRMVRRIGKMEMKMAKIISK
jgi:hypothetical protein